MQRRVLALLCCIVPYIDHLFSVRSSIRMLFQLDVLLLLLKQRLGMDQVEIQCDPTEI